MTTHSDEHLAGMAGSNDLNFQATGPGTWRLDSQHFPIPLTRFAAEILLDAFTSEWAQCEPHYPLFGTTTFAAANGFICLRREAPDSGRDRKSLIAAAVKPVNEKYWEAEARDWYETVKPDSIQSNLGLASVDVTELQKTELFDHLAACRENWSIQTPAQMSSFRNFVLWQETLETR